MGQQASSEAKPISVFVGTWNLGNVTPPDDLAWIPRKKGYDIYAIGVQEALYEHREGFLDNEMDWFMSVHRYIGEDKYECIAEQTLTPRTDMTYKTESAFRAAVREGKARPSGIRLSVYVSKKLVKEVQDTEVNLQTCGRLNGVSGNKGGISVSIRLGDTCIAFISCHLNAHMEELERRNQDYQTIHAGLHPTHLEFTEPETEEDTTPDDTREIEVANRHDAVFFFGDLNYRLAPPLGTKEAMGEEIFQCIRDKDWKQILDYDQLKNEQKNGRVFAGYKEPNINFAPTFKFSSKNRDSPDPTIRYSSKRVPSYCDRILYKEAMGTRVTCEEYISHETGFPNQSDHVPVSGVFMIPCVLGRPKAKDKKKEISVVIKDLKWEPNHVDSRIEPEAQITVTVLHKFAKERVTSCPSPLSKTQWKDPITLTSNMSEAECRQYPLLFAIRNRDSADSSMNKLGEGMVSLAKLHPSGVFAINVAQAGHPRGILHGLLELVSK